jgi:hypothetical protein
VQPTGAEARPTFPLRAPGSCVRSMWVRTVQLLRSGSTRPASAMALRVDTQKRWAVVSRPTDREIDAAEAIVSRFEVVEQLVRGYVAAHPVAARVLSDVRPILPPSRLQSALTAWDIPVHRTLAPDPDAADLVRIGRVQALIASAAPSSPKGRERRPKSTWKWSSE